MSEPPPHCALPLPSPLPDEHLFSVLARYHLISGNRVPATTRRQFAISDGPLRAQDIFNTACRRGVSAIAAALGTTPARIAQLNTLYPLFRLVLPDHVQRVWQRSWQAGSTPPAGLAVPQSHVLHGHDTSWRYCPSCVEDDRRNHGTAYWHVSHQLPGLGRCPHHGDRLRGRCTKCGASRRTLDRLDLPGPVCGCPLGCVEEAGAFDTAWLYELFRTVQSADSDISHERSMRLAADALGLSLPLKPPDREVAAERLKRVEAKVGEAALGRLFVFYRSADGLSAGRPRPNIVFTSLSDTCPGVRHPVYFLALFFGAGLGGEAIVGRSELGDREGKSDADGSDAAKGRRV